jgi:TonB family protein
MISFRGVATLCLSLCISTSALTEIQQADTASSTQSIGQQAITFLLSKLAVDNANHVPKTDKPLPVDGKWSIGKDTPAVCSKVEHPCVLILYTAAGTDVLCEWVILLGKGTEQSLILDTNEDAARYMSNKPMPHGAPPTREIVSSPIAIYPEAAKRQHARGVVKLLVSIDPSGHVDHVELISGPALFQQSAIAAAKQRIYKPLVVDSIPLRMRTMVEINYTFF